MSDGHFPSELAGEGRSTPGVTGIVKYRLHDVMSALLFGWPRSHRALAGARWGMVVNIARDIVACRTDKVPGAFGVEVPLSPACPQEAGTMSRERKRTSTYPLRLPSSLKAAVREVSRKDGTSINQFVSTAVAEKLSAMRTADFFAERGAEADIEAARRILRRDGGQPPVPEDRG